VVGAMRSSCQNFSVTRPQASPSAGTARPFGGSAGGQISDVEDGGFARSARTRRPVTGGLRAGRIGNGIVGRWSWSQYRVESV